MSRALVLTLILAPGCFVYTDGRPRGGYVNEAPYQSFVDASCYWDDAYRDYIWWFESEAHDPDGADDVVSIWADVYDNWDGALVESFELYPEGGAVWFSAWEERSTYLDCEYYDYTVAFVATDTADNQDVVDLVVY